MDIRAVGKSVHLLLVNVGSNPWRWYAAVLLGAALLYGMTCAPGYLWQDSGLIQYRVLNNDIVGFFGLAVSHPLYYLLAILVKALTPGWFPHSVNLISALAGAVTVANVFLLVRLWGGAPLPALVAALSLALSHTFWRHACIAETYTLWSALFTTELVFFRLYHHEHKNRYLYGLALVNGLALSVHNLALLSGVVYLLILSVGCVKRRISLKSVFVVMTLWCLGALPLIVLFLAQAVPRGELVDTLQSLAFGKKWQADVLNSHLNWTIVKENILYIGLNFPTPLILLMGLGILTVVKGLGDRLFGILLICLGILFLAFAARYTVPDRYAFFIPFYIILAIFLGIGADRLLQRSAERGLRVALILFAVCPVLIYVILPRFLSQTGVILATRGDVPYRDDVHYFLVPWRQHEQGPERFAREALEVVGPGALIFADQTTVPPLLLLQQQGQLRPDVHIVSAAVSSAGSPSFNKNTIDTIMEKDPVYVVSSKPGYCPSFVLERYNLVKTGVLWRVVPRGENNG